jgi:arabinan endo-1,5-alpha-L-arabinosidase
MTTRLSRRMRALGVVLGTLALAATSLPLAANAFAPGEAGSGVSAASAVNPASSAAVAASHRVGDPVAHDPTMVAEGGWYYVAITGDAGKAKTFIPLKRSRDLVHWEDLAPVFTTLPSWIAPALGVDQASAPKDLWAPDLSYSHGEWRLYYAASIFGRNTSVIGLATTKTLDPHSPAFGWSDRGPVVTSTDYRQASGSSYNAIDPSITVDRTGRTWMSFGSFFSGIWLHRIDAATGLVPAGDVAVHLAERAAPDAEENSTIVYRNGYYYLFLSFDYCCRGVESDYRTVVSRSTSITGPYVDASGVGMLNDKGGTEVMRGYNEFVGAGGADILLGSGGRPDLVVNHYYDATDGAVPKLAVRTLTWSRDGWPRVSSPLNPSRSVGHGDAYVTISPRGADTVVENAGCGYEGANIGLGTDLGTACQEWQLSDRGSGTRISNRFSNDVAEDAGCVNADGATVAQWGWLGFQGDNPCQRWTFGRGPDGYTTISTIQAGARSWTAEGDPAAAGTNIAIDAPATAANQQLRFEPVGSVLLASTGSPTATLGVAGCSTRHRGGAHAAFQRRSAVGCQTWTVTATDTGDRALYRVTNDVSHRRLVSTPQGLQVERAGSPGAGVWTLRPANDGTWTLASGSTTLSVKLLLP